MLASSSQPNLRSEPGRKGSSITKDSEDSAALSLDRLSALDAPKPGQIGAIEDAVNLLRRTPMLVLVKKREELEHWNS